jgi:hypothetical protein
MSLAHKMRSFRTTKRQAKERESKAQIRSFTLIGEPERRV